MILVFGIGNRLRRDDGAGHALAAALAPALEQATGEEVRVISVQQLAPELAEPIAKAETRALFFCDAALPHTGRPPLAAHRLATEEQGRSSLTHDVAPALLLAYASVLAPAQWTPPPAWLLTVVAADLEHGEGLSAGTQAALEGLPTLLASLLSELRAALADRP